MEDQDLCYLSAVEALEGAAAAEQRYAKGAAELRALEGLPVAIKDEPEIEGKRTTMGSLLLKDHIYFQPDGPFPNPAELMPLGKIDAARKAQEDAAEALTEDIIFVGKKLNEMGCEGLNFDTAASSGTPISMPPLSRIRWRRRRSPFIQGMEEQLRAR